MHHVDTADTRRVLFSLTSTLPRVVFRLAKTLLKPTWTFPFGILDSVEQDNTLLVPSFVYVLSW